MKKIFLFGFLLLFLVACKDIPFEKTYDIYEFMYQRVMPIVNPEGNDPRYLMVDYIKIGGKNVHLKQTGDNEWMGETILDYNISSQNPYYVRPCDDKVGAVAKDVFIRIKGQQDWIKLTLLKLHEEVSGIYWAAVFCLDKNGIYFPE